MSLVFVFNLNLLLWVSLFASASSLDGKLLKVSTLNGTNNERRFSLNSKWKFLSSNSDGEPILRKGLPNCK